MHALAIETWLDSLPGHGPAVEQVGLRTRGERVMTLLRRKVSGDSMLLEYDHIDREMMAVLARRETAAKNAAVVPALPLDGRKRPAHPREWYEFDSASDAELLFLIDALERDILKLAALCVRLANFAQRMVGPQ